MYIFSQHLSILLSCNPYRLVWYYRTRPSPSCARPPPRSRRSPPRLLSPPSLSRRARLFMSVWPHPSQPAEEQHPPPPPLQGDLAARGLAFSSQPHLGLFRTPPPPSQSQAQAPIHSAAQQAAAAAIANQFGE